MERAPLRRRGGGWFFVSLLLSATAVGAEAAEVLFPVPLHLTRRIEDPFSAGPVVVDEYCAGNRIVTVRGERVVIADYDRQETLDIDRGAGTYSITRFDEIARAVPAGPQAQSQRSAAPRSLGIVRGEAGRPIERFAIDHIELGVDRQILLNKAAIDVLLGAAYPNPRPPQHDGLIAAAGENLPAEQTIKAQFDGRDVVVRNIVTRIGGELVPPELLVIPAGARRVESHYTVTARAAGELDRR